MTVKIHGNDYVTVAERVQAVHKEHEGVDGGLFIETGIVHEDQDSITVKASVVTVRGKFQGHARSSKKASSIEGQSPLEVAETSAVGRALGFAGYGSVDSIASAEEVILAGEKTDGHLVAAAKAAGAKPIDDGPICGTCRNTMVIKTGTSKKTGLPWRGYFCPDRDCKSEPIWLPAEGPENLPEKGDVPFEDAEGPRASWSGFWARARELGIDRPMAHQLFGVPMEDKALLHYAEGRAKASGLSLQQVISDMQFKLGILVSSDA